MPRIFWVLIVALLAAWLAMNAGTAPRIEAMAGGLRLPEMRFTGYSYDDALAFLAAIGNDGTALYLGAQLRLDMLFPPLLAAVLFLGYRKLFPGWPGLVIGTAALSSVVVDYLENAAVARMLRAGADGLTPALATAANQWTMTKWSLALIGLLTLLIGIALRLQRPRPSNV